MRRNDTFLHTPAEKAISAALRAVEDVGADPRLTDAVILLVQARDKVADFVDGVPRAEPKGAHLKEARRRFDLATFSGGGAGGDINATDRGAMAEVLKHLEEQAAKP